ncbi:MAG: acyltransferase domain-containing protein, partial [Proteobacteria bacterium]|nr:acyltransferase domain-containing protein [Pseudomonadota bacterium]
GEGGGAVLTGESLGNDLPVTFLFSGNGAQWAGMGRAAWHASTTFRDALREIDERFRRRHAMSPDEAMLAEDLAPRLRRATVAQPLLLALQMATVRSLEAQGLSAQAVLGHSVGEIAAAWCAGVLATDQAIDIVVARSRHQEITRGSGAMAALMLGERDAEALLAEAGGADVDLAAINSWRSVTVSGTVEAIDRVLTVAGTRRIGARRLDLDYPFHSRLVEAVRGPLLRDLRDLQPRAARRRFVSSVSGQTEDGRALDAGWWWRNVREPVRFEAALRGLVEDGHRLFVEIGPRPILGSYVRDALREADLRGQSIETLDEIGGEAGHDPLERTVGRVALAGGRVDRERLFGPPPVQTQPLPSYPWRHVAYRVSATGEASSAFEPMVHPLLGTRPRRDAWSWFATVDPAVLPWLSDHAVGGVTVFPAAGFVEALLAAAREIHGDGALELRDLDIVRPLAFDDATSFETQVRVSAETGSAEFLSRPRGGAADWSLHARGIVGRAPPVEAAPIDPANAGRVVVPRSRVYDVARGLGFDYGPAFRRLRHVTFPQPKQALGLLDRDAGVALDGRVIDLTGLDAAFHALFASEEAGVADRPMARMLPVRFARVRAYAPGAMARHVVAHRRRQTAGSMVTDITLADADGRVLLDVVGARLVEAPAPAPADPRTLVYRLQRWQLDRPGAPSALVVPELPAPVADAGLDEALLLIEAGCLRAAWEALRTGAPRPAGESATWPDYLCAALSWHLETRGLGRPAASDAAASSPAETCALPSLGSLVRTLVERHPTMAIEAAALARLDSGLARLASRDGSPKDAIDDALGVVAGQGLEASSRQVAALRDSALEALRALLRATPAERRVRLLAIGAAHASALKDLLDAFPQVEAVLTDLEADRLDQAQAVLGTGVGALRTVPWSALAAPGGAVFDAAIVIDALGPLAATGDGLARLRALLRPQAPVIAAEPAPAIFWDIVRAARPGWWARSAHVEFPVGPLLGAEEWRDELAAAGFTAVDACPLSGDPALGVRLVARRGAADATAALPGSLPAWDGADTPLARVLRERLADAAPPARDPEPATVAFVVDALAPSTSLPDTLARLARACSTLAGRAVESDRSLHVVVTGAPDGTPDLDSLPAWTAITAALRVAQNEYPALDIRCLGVADARPATLAAAVLELAASDSEREVVIEDGRRFVFRLVPGLADPAFRAAPVPAEGWALSGRSGSSRGTLAWTRASRTAPATGQVEIAVAATGLNFRDVMWQLGLLPEEALEDGYAGPRL